MSNLAETSRSLTTVVPKSHRSGTGRPASWERESHGKRILDILIGLAKTGRTQGPSSGSTPCRITQHGCEFDYEYYVALQRRRRFQTPA